MGRRWTALGVGRGRCRGAVRRCSTAVGVPTGAERCGRLGCGSRLDRDDTRQTYHDKQTPTDMFCVSRRAVSELLTARYRRSSEAILTDVEVSYAIFLAFNRISVCIGSRGDVTGCGDAPSDRARGRWGPVGTRPRAGPWRLIGRPCWEQWTYDELELATAGHAVSWSDAGPVPAIRRCTT